MYGMAVISRAVAKQRKLKRYFTGTPCRDGHVAERVTYNGVCAACALIKRLDRQAERAAKTRRGVQLAAVDRHRQRRAKTLDFKIRSPEATERQKAKNELMAARALGATDNELSSRLKARADWSANLKRRRAAETQREHDKAYNLQRREAESNARIAASVDAYNARMAILAELTV